MAFKLSTRFDDGTCAALASTPQLTNARLGLRWRSSNPTGRPKTIASTRARIANASYDTGSHSLTMVTDPIAKGAFAGRTVTLQLGFDSYVEAFESGCSEGGGLLGMTFGRANPSTLEVQ